MPAAAYALEVDGETPANQQIQDIFDQDQGQQHPPDSIGRVSEYADHDPRGFPMREFLMSEREADLPYMQELVLGLRFLEDRCNEKLKAQPDSNRGAKPKPSIFAKNIPNAHTMCALMVLLWWQKQTGQLPGVRKAEALAACAQLWKAARGQERTHPAKSAEDRGTTGWRASMKDARDRWLETWQAEAIRNILGDWG